MRFEHPENALAARLLARDKSIAGVRMKALSYAVMAGLSLGASGTAMAQQEGTRAQSLEEVIVTARRKEEAVQTIPLAMTAITPEQLNESGVKDVRDLTSSVPGVNITSSGAANNTLFSIRGRSKGTIGIAQSSVATYINEVPVSNWGAAIPTFDLASVQVLKGPQGTLFGRNSTTGAMLVQTAEPEDSLGGYVMATVGDYNWRQLEGAINLPVIEDKLAIRLAAQVADRDGFTENMSFDGHDMDDLNRDNYRLSVKFSPTDALSNVLVYEYNEMDEVPGAVLYKHNTNPALPINAVPYTNGTLGALVPPTPCGGQPRCDVNVIADRQEDAGERKAWTDQYTFLEGELHSVMNTTTYDTDAFTIKNVLGYRTVKFSNVSDIDATELAALNADTLVANKQLTEELQIAGSALDDSLDYVAGLFYLKSEPNGDNHLLLQQFAISGTPLDAPAALTTPAPFRGARGSSDYYEEESRAVYGQITYKLGELASALEPFSVDIGARYTEDEQSVCNVAGQQLADPTVSQSECNSLSSPRYTTQSGKFDQTTWTFGLNYQATDSVFLYAVTRKGYRGGGLNTPILGGTLAPYQTFEPETVQDIELGLKSDFSVGDVLGRFNIAVFQSNFEDVQTAISGASDGDTNPDNNPSNLTFYANAGEAVVEGVEAELTVSPTENLQFSVSGAYLDKKLENYNEGLSSTGLNEQQVKNYVFLASPRFSYNVGIDYTWPMNELGDLVFQYKYFRISEIIYGSILADAYEESDFRLAWKNIGQSGVDVAAFMTNAFDEVGVAAPAGSTNIGINSVIYNEPRLWGVQVQYKFGAN